MISQRIPSNGLLSENVRSTAFRIVGYLFRRRGRLVRGKKWISGGNSYVLLAFRDKWFIRERVKWQILFDGHDST